MNLVEAAMVALTNQFITGSALYVDGGGRFVCPWAVSGDIGQAVEP